MTIKITTHRAILSAAITGYLFIRDVYLTCLLHTSCLHFVSRKPEKFSDILLFSEDEGESVAPTTPKSTITTPNGRKQKASECDSEPATPSVSTVFTK